VNFLKYKISLMLQSPMLIGGKKQGSNYIKSMEYIPGSVMRAAFARVITDRCSFDEKNRWVSFENADECRDCTLKKLCKNFDSMRFSFMYPQDSKPYPLTNMRCKYESAHPDVDTLIYQINKHRGKSVRFNNKCASEGCKERLEKHGGFHKNGQDVELDYRFITKNSVNPYLKHAKESILYSLDVVTEKCFLGDKQEPTEFCGYIESCEDIEDELYEVGMLRVGAYTTGGFGKCKLCVNGKTDGDNTYTIEKRISEFNKLINDSSRLYIAFTLMSDAYLGLEECFSDKLSPSQVTTSEYMEEYKKILYKYTGENLRFEFPIAENELRRGFDTSGEQAVLRRGKILTKMGSILVYSLEKDLINYNEILNIQNNGIGANVEHGFGQVVVCSEFHYEKAMK